MTEQAIEHATSTLSGLARGLAIALNSPSVERKERIKRICQHKITRLKSIAEDEVAYAAIENALQNDQLEDALHMIFSIHPFHRVGARYTNHEQKLVMVVPQPEVEPEPAPVSSEEESSNQSEETVQDNASISTRETSNDPGLDTENEILNPIEQVPVESDETSSKAVEASPLDPHELALQRLEDEIKALVNKISKSEPKPKDSTNAGREGRRNRVFFWDTRCGLMRIEDLSPELEEETVATLQSNGIANVADLLYTPPTEFLKIKPSSLEESGKINLFRGQIAQKFTRLRSQLVRYEVVIEHKSGSLISCSWLSRKPRGWEQWEKGLSITLIGELEADDNFQLFEPEPAGIDGRGSGWLPVYAIDGVEDRVIRDLMCAALGLILLGVQDPLPRSILQGSKMLFFDEALRDAHFPSNASMRGFERLIFDESFYYLLRRKFELGLTSNAGLRTRITHSGIGKVSHAQGIQLNDKQEVAFSIIRRALISNTAMRHILQGDIGAGKWTISLFSLIATAESESQAIYACTDIITAERRYWMAEPILKTLGISCQLCVSTPNRAQQDAIKNGVASVVFGTKEILSPEISWKNLRLIIVEESKEYGSLVPLEYMKQRPAPDVLMVTPTPISSQVLDAVYPAFSLIQVPVKSLKPSYVEILKSEDRSQAYAKLKQHIENGQQAYIVFPVKNGRDLLNLADAHQFASAIQSELLEGIRIAVFSSELDRDARRQVLEDFQQRRVDVLLCTTFIEDAPTLLNATGMVIEYAELNAVSRLHRLRGHVSRGYKPAYSAWLPSEQATEAQIEQLETLKGITNGYKIAEMEETVYGLQELIGLETTQVEQRWSKVQPNVYAPRIKARNMVTLLNEDGRSELDWDNMRRVLCSYYPDLVLEDKPKSSKHKRRKRRYHKNKRSKK
ncbi:MAG: helicase-related protein [Myxococcota bacterium]|nr:helicase-related protein [Myxococcota bacterium]